MTMLLLDANNLLHRAYYRVREHPQPVEAAIRAVMTDVRDLVYATRASRATAALDGRGNFRKTLYPAYKGTRKERDEAMTELLQRSAEIFAGAGAQVCVAPGFEADDVLATLAVRSDADLTLLVSTDRDLFGALRASPGEVTLVNPVQRRRVRACDVPIVFGCTPERVPLFKAIAGDASDNIPGVRGLGPKAARELTANYTSVRDLFADVPALPPAVRKKLAACDPAEIELFERLATLVTDVPVEVVA